ncbi:MAG: amidohydrolase [Tissierellia bacterium]|nr:amidohydrolase [Tissierellia bacterium]
MKDLLERAKEINDFIVDHRRYLHENPELGMELPNTVNYVCGQLEEMGYQPEILGSSVVATIGKEGKTFLIRGDMDALPITEETGLDFASNRAGVMHACGHDTHTAMLLGAAKLLKENESNLKGRVKLFFQAGEEILEGAKEAIELGLLDNPKVDAAMMIHILSNTPTKEGSILLPTDGGAFSSADWFRVDIRGKGGHGASPQNAKSPIDALCAINSGMHEIISSAIPPEETAVMSVGEISAGQEGSGNVIPDTGHLSGTIRTFNEEVRGTIKSRLESLVDYTSKSRDVEGKLTYGHTAPVAENNAELKAFSIDVLTDLLGEEYVVDLSVALGGMFKRVSGSEDFSYVSREVPSTFLMLAAGTPDDGYAYPGHNPKTDFNESVFYVGAASYAALAMAWLENN